jgi:hypothetical protein
MKFRVTSTICKYCHTSHPLLETYPQLKDVFHAIPCEEEGYAIIELNEQEDFQRLIDLSDAWREIIMYNEFAEAKTALGYEEVIVIEIVDDMRY